MGDPSRIVGWADEMLRINFLRCAVGNSGSTCAARQAASLLLDADGPGSTRGELWPKVGDGMNR